MNELHLKKLSEGVGSWNQWRKDNPTIRPDLSYANLSKFKLKNVDFSNTDLGKVDFSEAYLNSADFSCADMALCDFSSADVSLAHFEGAVLWASNFDRTNVSDIHWDKKTKFKGINVNSCYSNEIFKVEAQNRSYLEEYKIKRPKRYFIWKILSNCGDSWLIWTMWSFFILITFAGIYYWLGINHFDTGNYLKPSFSTMVYYSIVTFTTLGFGDITPKIPIASLVVTIEVIFGYIMLGGLITLFSRKFIRKY